MMDLSIDIHTVPVDPKTSSLVEGCKLNVLNKNAKETTTFTNILYNGINWHGNPLNI